MLSSHASEGVVSWPRHWTTERESKHRRPRRAGYSFVPKQIREQRLREFEDDVERFVARRVRSERIQAGHRQIDLADAIGVSTATLSRIESAARQVTLAE